MQPSIHPSSERDSGRGFSARARFDDPLTVVVMSGELDLATCGAAVRACVSMGHRNVVVDMAALTFMDCAGYRELVIARLVLERRGGSLTLLAPAGEPLRLLTLLEQGSPGPTFISRCAPAGEAPRAPALS
jgi:anti-anti-sigma factor